MKADTIGPTGHGGLFQEIKAFLADSQELADEVIAKAAKAIDRQLKLLLWASCANGATLLPGGWTLAARPNPTEIGPSRACSGELSNSLPKS